MHISNWRNNPLRWSLGASILAIVVALGVAGSAGWRRVMFERSHAFVELVVSYRDMVNLSRFAGIESEDLLSRIAKQGIVKSIAVEEDTLPDMVSDGRAVSFTGNELQHLIEWGRYPGDGELAHAAAVYPNRNFWIFSNESDFERIRTIMNLDNPTTVVVPDSKTLVVRTFADDVKELGLGFSEDRVNALRDMGFNVSLRLKNSGRVTDNLINLKFAQVSQVGPVHSIIFDGTSILGYPFHIDTVASYFGALKIPYGVVEFSDQMGMPSLVRKLPRFALRVHSFSDAEMLNLSTETVVNRYVRAARERNVKILFLKPFLVFQPDAFSDTIIDANLLYFSEVGTRLQASDFVVGALPKMAPDRRLGVGPLEALTLCIGVWGAVWLLLWRLRIPLSNAGWVVGALVVMLSFIGCGVIHIRLLAQQIAALVTAMTVPALIIVVADQMVSNRTDRGLRPIASVAAVLGSFLGVCVGGALIVGLLSDYSFLIESNRFLGVKLAVLAPLMLLGIYFGIGRDRLTEMASFVRRLLQAPVRYVNLVALTIGIIFLGVILVRSGNYLISQPGSSEQTARQWLEVFFSVRPRTKELFGYPLLIWSFAVSRKSRYYRWRWIGVCAGSVAIISALNSFCHLHTPLRITVYRDLLGLALGVAIGVLGFFIKKGVSWVTTTVRG
ncbi:hypothetical protein EB093_03700 [bacterium]|nr:hypothetical protein [bacterium]